MSVDGTVHEGGGARPAGRRPRYRGSHPRHFREKYKELDAARHPAIVARVAAKGKTPAGSHRPICVAEVLKVLDPRPGLVAVDATLGYGGHAQALLERLLPGGRLIGLDVDPIELPRTRARLEALGMGQDSFVAVRTNFAALSSVIAGLGVDGVDLVLADLGCSSMQFDDPARGFTFKEEGPLDLRLNPRRPESAAALLARMDVEPLAAMLEENADEPRAASIAQAIVARKGGILTTTQLAAIVRAVVPAGRDGTEANATLQRVFQALRIAVNDEFGVLEIFLRALPEVLRPGGRAAILTFHSGEDRRVKRSFAGGLHGGVYSEVSGEPIRPSGAEVRSNPRARSAKLRWCRRCG